MGKWTKTIMKHLLILLSILLLSSPLFGDNHKGETLYRWGEYPFEWRGFGEKGTHLKYQGEVENGKPNGLGIITSPDGKKYVGDFKDGVPNGQGTFTNPDGGIYVGEWKDGNSHGKGIETFPDGRKHDGEFKDGVLWKGTEYDKNGNITGKWVNGVKQ